MSRILTKLVDLREGEGRTLLGAFLSLFGIVAGHTMLETARDALFLSRLPPNQLTLVYVAIALGTLLVSSANASFVRRFGQRNALVFTLVLAAYVTTVLHFQRLTPAILYALYGWSALIGTVLGVQFWMFAGQLFTVAQGKRLFAPLASGGVLGAVAGASSAAAAVAFVPVRTLLLASAGVFLVTALLLTAMPSPSEEATALRPARGAPPPRPEIGTIALFREVPYLRRLALFVALGTAALLVTDYLFKSIAAATVPKAALGAFFARTYAVLNVLSLAVQLLVASRVLRRLGVVAALGILPFCVALGGGGMVLFGGALALALFAKGADGALRYSLQRVATELLWMPLGPGVRDRAKALIDSVFGKVVQAVVAALLLLLVPLGLDAPRVLGAIALVLAIGWLAATVALRAPYVDLFRQALSRGSIDSEGVELDISSVEAVLEAISSRDPDRVIGAMELLHEKGRGRLVPGLVLYHESEEVLLRAMPIVATADRKDWIPLAERLLDHASERVRVAAVRALAAGGLNVAAIRSKMQDDPSSSVRAHLALSATEDDCSALNELLALEGEAGRAGRVALLEAVRDHPDPRWNDLVFEFATSGEPGLEQAAAAAMGSLVDARFIPVLLGRLASRSARATAREALVAQGEPALDALAAAALDPELDPQIRLHLPRTISRFHTQRAADLLFELLLNEKRGFLRYKALRGLGRLVADHGAKLNRARVDRELRKHLVEVLRTTSLAVPFTRGAAGAEPSPSESLVLGLLSDKRRQALERAFRVLQIAHRGEDIQVVHAAIQSGDKRLRAQALEFLDALTTVPPRDRRRDAAAARARDELRELIRLVSDDLPDHERVARAGAFLSKVPKTKDEALALLLEDGDDTLAMLAAFHALELGSHDLQKRVAGALELRPTLAVATPLVSPLAPASLRRPEVQHG